MLTLDSISWGITIVAFLVSLLILRKSRKILVVLLPFIIGIVILAAGWLLSGFTMIFAYLALSTIPKLINLAFITVVIVLLVRILKKETTDIKSRIIVLAIALIILLLGTYYLGRFF